MRFVRTIAGMVLLTVGLLALVAGGSLWTVMGHRDAGGAFTGVLERVETPGYAMVVPELGDLLRRNAPLVQKTQARLRIAAATPAGPAFLGLAPADAADRYLAGRPYAKVDNVAVALGRLPLRVTEVEGVDAAPGDRRPSDSPSLDAAPSDFPSSDAAATRPAGGPAEPASQPFWVRHGEGSLDLDPADLTNRKLSLVIMRADARQGVTLDLRVEARAGWLDPTAWGLITGGAVLLALGVAILIRPRRPREVVFVVEPRQVPRLAARLGVTGLNDIGRTAPRTSWRFAPAVPASGQSYGRATVPERADEAVPVPVGDLAPVTVPAPAGEPAPVPVTAPPGEPAPVPVTAPAGEPAPVPVTAPAGEPAERQSYAPVQAETPIYDRAFASLIEAARPVTGGSPGPAGEAGMPDAPAESTPPVRPVHLVRGTGPDESRPARPVWLVGGTDREDRPVARSLTLASAPAVPAPAPTKPAPTKPIAPVPTPPPAKPARPVPTPPPNRPVPAGPEPSGSESELVWSAPVGGLPERHPGAELGLTRPVPAAGAIQRTDRQNGTAGEPEPATNPLPDWGADGARRRNEAKRTDQPSDAC